MKQIRTPGEEIARAAALEALYQTHGAKRGLTRPQFWHIMHNAIGAFRNALGAARYAVGALRALRHAGRVAWAAIRPH